MVELVEGLGLLYTRDEKVGNLRYLFHSYSIYSRETYHPMALQHLFVLANPKTTS